MIYLTDIHINADVMLTTKVSGYAHPQNKTIINYTHHLDFIFLVYL